MESKVIILEEDKKAMQVTTTSLRSELDDTNNLLDSARTACQSLKEENSALGETMNSLSSEVCDLKSSLTLSRSECLDLKSQCRIMTNNLETLGSGKDVLQRKLEELDLEVARLQVELDCAQRLLRAKMAELTTVTAARDDFTVQMEATNAEKIHAIQQLSRTRDQLAQCKLAVLALENDKTEIKKLQAELDSKDSRLRESNRKIFSLEESVKKMHELREEKSQLQDKYNAMLVEQEMLLGHTNKKQKIHYIQALKSQIQALAEENNRLRSTI